MSRPEALRLANALDRQYLHACEPAAAELRRLHAQRDSLLAALKAIAENSDDVGAIDCARAAIAKAEGQ